MSSSPDRARSGFTQRPPNWKDLGKSLWKHLLHTAVVAVAAFTVTLLLLEVNWEHTHIGLKLLTALGVTLIAELALVAILHFLEDTSAQKEHLEELGHLQEEALKLVIEKNEIEEALQSFGEYFRLERREEMLSVLRNHSDELSRALHNRHFTQQQHFLSLLSGTPAMASYRDQHEFADVLASSAQSRLWTTCVDMPAIFQVRNYSYMSSLESVPGHLDKDYDGDNPPPVCRIFVGECVRFFEDARENYDKWIDLYKWHLAWGRDSESTAVRFFSVKNIDEYHDLFLDANIAQAGRKAIHDYMVVDNSIVYGRTLGVGEEVAELHLVNTPDLLDKYGALFESLWDQSKTVYDLIDRLIAEQGACAELTDLKEQCVKAESKLNISSDYGVLFGVAQRKGIPFFGRLCELISESKGYCFAVDRASKKRGNLWDSWQSTPYKEFREASESAAITPETQFHRLFVLEGKLQKEDKKKLKTFIEEFVSKKIHVGFILRQDTGLGAIGQRYDTDFIVVNYREDMAEDQTSGLGFELQDADFKVIELEMESNLIAKQRLQEHFKVFFQLWNNPKAKVVHDGRSEEMAAVFSAFIQETK